MSIQRFCYVLKLVSVIIASIYISEIKAQDAYIGTFMTANGALSLQIKAADGIYHGALQSADGVFAIKANTSDNKLEGVVYSEQGNFKFIAKSFQSGLIITSEGTTYEFNKISNQHQLASFDLRPYFKEIPSQSNDKTNSKPIQNNDPANRIASEYDKYFEGSQLVYYQKTSIFNDSSASSLTYVNFCADGRFSINYDGSFSVEGDYGGNAHGISRGTNHGTWHIDNANQAPKLIITFANGNINTYSININSLKSGRWRLGNTQYALLRNKVICN